MSKVMLIMPPSPRQGEYDGYKVAPEAVLRIPPVGLFHIATYLKSHGHEVVVVECRALIVQHQTSDYIPHLCELVKGYKPDIIGVSALTLTFNESVKVCQGIKEKFDIPIILGGVHASVEPELTLIQNPYADALCIGEGEDAMLELIENKRRPDGIMWRGKEKEYIPRQRENDLDKYPCPDYTLGDTKFYIERTTRSFYAGYNSELGMITSRSCCFNCFFCATQWSKPYRAHSVAYVVDAVKQLTKYNIDSLVFYDDSFVQDSKRLEEICHRFIKEQLFRPYKNIVWYCGTRASQVNLDLMKLMKEAGCDGVSIGIESGCDKTLKVINKQTTVEMNRRACEIVMKSGLKLKIQFMLGLPHETKEDMEQTASFIRSVKCFSKNIGIFRPLPGCTFYNQFIEQGILNKATIDWDEIGNTNTISKQIYCDTSREMLEVMYDKASIACDDSWFGMVRRLLPLGVRKQWRKLIR